MVLLVLLVFALSGALLISVFAFWVERRRRIAAETMRHVSDVKARALWHMVAEIRAERNEAIQLSEESSALATRLVRERVEDFVERSDQLIASIVKPTETSSTEGTEPRGTANRKPSSS